MAFLKSQADASECGEQGNPPCREGNPRRTRPWKGDQLERARDVGAGREGGRGRAGEVVKTTLGRAPHQEQLGPRTARWWGKKS